LPENHNESKMNGRYHGPGPYRYLVIHGGPGAPGSAGLLSEAIGRERGVLEPFQTADSVQGQIRELAGFIENHAQIPVDLIGHSWGAWLAFLFTAQNQEKVKKLILISAGPFEEKYASSVRQTRLNRLSQAERKEYEKWLSQWECLDPSEKKNCLKEIGALMQKADGYDLENRKDSTVDYQPEVFKKVWREASYFRSSGRLLEEGRKIRSEVIAIHGDYDPHPWQGVKEPLQGILSHFDFYLLKHCGHEPWMEKQAKEDFYKILRRALSI